MHNITTVRPVTQWARRSWSFSKQSGVLLARSQNVIWTNYRFRYCTPIKKADVHICFLLVAALMQRKPTLVGGYIKIFSNVRCTTHSCSDGEGSLDSFWLRVWWTFIYKFETCQLSSFKTSCRCDQRIHNRWAQVPPSSWVLKLNLAVCVN